MRWRRGHRSEGAIFVAGLFGSAAGIGQAARLFADALEAEGFDVRRIDAGPSIGHSADIAVRGEPPYGAGVLVTFLNPPEMLRWLTKDGAGVLKNKRHVGYWFWELPAAPKQWRRAFAYVDEVWCQSNFTGDALRGISPPGMKISVVPHPVFINGDISPDRRLFGISEGVCVVFASADLRSTSARKNPLAAIEAFVRAAPKQAPDDLIFICKIRGADVEPKTAQLIRSIAAARNDIFLLEENLSSEAMLTLLASIDIAISLHRSEGFGLLPAEAIWFGKPVVTTGWSGVLDFLTPECAALVDWTLVAVNDAQGVYAGGLWAEPNIDDAAKKLKLLIENREFRLAIGVKAREQAQSIFSRARWIENISSRLALSVKL